MRPVANLFCCLLCGASAEENPFSHWGGREGAASVSIQHLHLLFLKRQPSFFTVCEMHLCISGRIIQSHEALQSSLFVCKEAAKLAMKCSQFSLLRPSVSVSIITNPHVTVQSLFVHLNLLRSSLAQSPGPLFVSVYVIAWQGSAPSRLCVKV